MAFKMSAIWSLPVPSATFLMTLGSFWNPSSLCFPLFPRTTLNSQPHSNILICYSLKPVTTFYSFSSAGSKPKKLCIQKKENVIRRPNQVSLHTSALYTVDETHTGKKRKVV